VSRLRCRGENTEADCTLDVNVEIYPLKTNDKFMFALSATLAEDGTPDDGNFDQARPREGRRAAGWNGRRLTPRSCFFLACRAATKSRYLTSSSTSCTVRAKEGWSAACSLKRRRFTGKIYKIAEDRSSAPPKTEVYASFGGLLMLLKASAAGSLSCLGALTGRSATQGEPSALKDLEVDKRVYLLARRV